MGAAETPLVIDMLVRDDLFHLIHTFVTFITYWSRHWTLSHISTHKQLLFVSKLAVMHHTYKYWSKLYSVFNGGKRQTHNTGSPPPPYSRSLLTQSAQSHSIFHQLYVESPKNFHQLTTGFHLNILSAKHAQLLYKSAVKTVSHITYTVLAGM